MTPRPSTSIHSELGGTQEVAADGKKNAEKVLMAGGGSTWRAVILIIKREREAGTKGRERVVGDEESATRRKYESMSVSK